MLVGVQMFRCAACSTEVSRLVREVPLPDPQTVRAPYEVEGFEDCPPHVAPGTFAYDPEPSRFWYVPAPEEGERVHVPGGPTGSVVLSPTDAVGMVPVADPGRRNGCCGPDGSDGANLACAGCGAELAIESADCWTFQEIVLDPRRVMADG